MTAAVRPLVVTLRREAGRMAATCAGGEAPVRPQRFECLGVEETLTLVQLIWNVCAAAQEGALRAALGLPVSEALRARIVADAVRDHVLHLSVHLPGALGHRRDPDALHQFALGRHGAVADAVLAGAREWRDMRDLARWARDAGTPAADSVRSLLALPEGAGATRIPLLPETPRPGALGWDARHHAGRPVDAGTPVRWAPHPLMRSIEAMRGRDLLWRTAARLLELRALLAGVAMPPVRPLGEGVGAALAARGTMLVEARAAGGRITRFRRLSPTDCAAAPGGLVEAAMTTLPADHRAEELAEIVLAVHDLCVPVTLDVALAHGERALAAAGEARVTAGEAPAHA